MKLDCQILEAVQRDFNALWTCKQLGETLEISTPYLLPDSRLVSVYLTERNGRYIVCESGIVQEILDEYCSLPADEAASELASMAAKFKVKQGAANGGPIYFKETSEPKFDSVSSIRCRKLRCDEYKRACRRERRAYSARREPL